VGIAHKSIMALYFLLPGKEIDQSLRLGILNTERYNIIALVK